MEMVGRAYNPALYRFGFNGKEDDNEVKGLGDQQNYGMRIYDPRLGRFLSVDPLTPKYPGLTPYQFSSNRPIDGIDMDGLEFRKSAGAFFTTSDAIWKPALANPSASIIADNLRQKMLPKFYQDMGVTSFAGLTKAIGDSKQKLDNLSASRGAPSNPTSAAESASRRAIKFVVESFSAEGSAYKAVEEQVGQLYKSIQIVDKANSENLIPTQFQNDPAFASALINYLFDGTLAKGDGPKLEAYNNIIKTIGKELFANQDEVLNGSYKRPTSQITDIVIPSFHLDIPSESVGIPSSIPLVTPVSTEKLDNLVNTYNATTDGCVNCQTVSKPQ